VWNTSNSALIHMRCSLPCSKLHACAGQGIASSRQGYSVGTGMVLQRLNVVLRPAEAAGSAHVDASSQHRKHPPFYVWCAGTWQRHCLKSPCLVLRRRRDRRSGPHQRLVSNTARKHREGASPKHRGLGRELIVAALPYSHSAEARYELDERGLQCSIALPLGMDGRQERL
jgi:hypothetical protein